MADFPATSGASGIWRLKQQKRAVQGQNWPGMIFPPGAPTSVTATASNAQATVSFVAPNSNGGSAITSYTVTSSPGGITASGASSPITVTGLTNGTAYTFTVTATNAAGTGPASSPSNSVTPIASRIFTISPAVSGKSTWNLDSDGALNVSSAGALYTIVPQGSFTASAKMWGAGGYPGQDGGSTAGAGGYSAGNIALTGGTTYYIRVGAPGQAASTGSGRGGGGGGGGTAIYTGSDTPILVAGGGGGGAGYANQGGAGGGSSGQAGTANNGPNGSGGTQSGPGAGDPGGSGRNGGNSNGSGGGGVGGTGFGNGGTGSDNPGDGGGGGGGGGYYGGGAGGAGTWGGAGGGGSGYFNPSFVTSGTTTAGSYTTPGNSGDGNRGSAGSQGNPGRVYLY